MRVATPTGNFVQKAGDTMTGFLQISTDGVPALVLNRITAGNIVAQQGAVASIAKYYLGYNPTTDEFTLFAPGLVEQVGWTVATGKQVRGSVPLARMGTVLLDSSVSLTANATTIQTVEADANVHGFYLHDAYIAGNVQGVTIGSEVSATETVVAGVHTFIQRHGAGGNVEIRMVNGTATAQTGVFKVYKLTET